MSSGLGRFGQSSLMVNSLVLFKAVLSVCEWHAAGSMQVCMLAYPINFEFVGAGESIGFVPAADIVGLGEGNSNAV